AEMCIRDRVTAVLSVADHWQQDLSQIPGLVELVTADLDAILTCGMRNAVKPLC
ncbi:altronate oxidoreductase, partial [Klebsiella pneumoniae]